MMFLGCFWEKQWYIDDTIGSLVGLRHLYKALFVGSNSMTCTKK